MSDDFMVDEDERHVEEQDARTRRTRAALIVALVILILLLTVLGIFFFRVLVPAGQPDVEASGEEGLVWIRSLYGFGPAENEQLFKPTSVAFGSGGVIYANDPQRARVMVFRPDGTFQSLIHTGMGGTGPGQLARPDNMATSDSGDLYITDSVGGKVIVFDSNGEFVREWQAPGASGIDVVGDEVYLVIGGPVSVYSLEGEFLYEFGERGRGTGAVLESALGITADPDLVYIADGLNKSFKAFDRDGEMAWVKARTTPEQDPHSDVETGTIDPIEEPDDEDLVDLPQDVVIDGSDRLVGLDAFSFKILVMEKETGEITASYGDVGTTDGLFFYPTGIDYDEDRDWFAIADTDNNRVQIVRIAGSGDSLGAAAQRALVSPFRVCLIPLLALLLVLIAALILRRRRNRRAGLEVQSEEADN